MLSKKSLFLLSLLCVGLVFCEDPAPAAHEEEGGKTPATDVIELNAESFDKTIAANKVILVEFYATWCGHCQKFAPTYDRIATALKAESIPVARINAAENDEVSQAQKIEGFPTIRLFVNGKGIEYRGRREFDDVISFVHKGVQPALLALGSKAEVDSFLAANPTTVIACFGDPETEGMELRDAFFEVASDLHARNDIAFGIVERDPALSGAAKCPSLIARQQGGDKPSEYDFGDMADDASAPLRTADAMTRWAVAVTTPVFDEISAANFQRYIEAGLPMVWVITDPKLEAFEAMKPWMRKIALDYVGKLSFVWLDNTIYGQQGKLLGVSGRVLPTLSISSGRAKFVIGDEASAKLTEESVRSWLADFIAGKLQPTVRSQPAPDPVENEKKFVKDVVATTFAQVVLDPSKDVLVKFYATWCGHCQALAPIYEEVGKLLASVPSIVVTQIDAPENDTPDNVHIRGYPTLVFFPAMNKAPLEYQGDRSVGEIIDFIHTNAGVAFELPADAADLVQKAKEAKKKAEQLEETAEEQKEL